MAKSTIKTHVFDSRKGLELPNHRVYAITYEPLWQTLRATTNFKDVDSARAALAKFEAYMARAVGEEEMRRRVFRVYNLLRALPLGQTNSDGISLIQLDVERHVLPYRKQVAERAKAIGQPTEWDWETSRRQLRIIYQENPKGFRAALTKLKDRASRKEPKPELRYYLTLFEEVMFDKSETV